MKTVAGNILITFPLQCRCLWCLIYYFYVQIEWFRLHVQYLMCKRIDKFKQLGCGLINVTEMYKPSCNDYKKPSPALYLIVNKSNFSIKELELVENVLDMLQVIWDMDLLAHIVMFTFQCIQGHLWEIMVLLMLEWVYLLKHIVARMK